jgi:hypothetical protein
MSSARDACSAAARSMSTTESLDTGRDERASTSVIFFGHDGGPSGRYPGIVDPLVTKLLASRQPDGQLGDAEEARKAHVILRNIAHSIRDAETHDPRRWQRVNCWGDYRWAIHEASEFEINLGALRHAVGAYLDHCWMHTPAADWLCADALVYETYRATAQSRIIDAEGYANARIYLGKEKPGFSSMVELVGTWIVKWGIWAAVLVWLYTKTGWIAPTIQLALTVPYVAFRWRMKSKTRHMTNAMVRVYRCLDTTAVSWSAVAREMEDARKLGAWWPGELWRLVESRAATA